MEGDKNTQKLELAAGVLESRLVSRDLMIQEGRIREARLSDEPEVSQQQRHSLRVVDQLAQASLEEITRKFRYADGQVTHLTNMRGEWARQCRSLQDDLQRANDVTAVLRRQYQEKKDALGIERAARLNAEASSNENKSALQEMTRSRDFWHSHEKEATRQCEIARDDFKAKVLDLGRLEEKLRREHEEAGQTSTTL